jgi:phosphohistidine swiveling domain-containing protein
MRSRSSADAVNWPLALRHPAARGLGVGAKASLLATAAAKGLPVLGGMVLPAAASEPAIAAGADALAQSGRPQAYLAASSVDVTSTELDVLASVGKRLVVRSSTARDLDGRWSGAFASYVDVEPHDLSSAVRGCWSSVFTRDALDRCEATGTNPSSLRVGVLVQPCLPFVFGGTARVDPDGHEVVVTIARSGPHGVVNGDNASTIVVSACRHTDCDRDLVPCVNVSRARYFDGDTNAPSGVVVAAGRHVDGDTDVPAGVAVAAAKLARDTLRATGVGAIEWGATGERIVLLQIGPDVARGRSAQTAVVPPASLPADAGGVAAIVARFRGALADDLVLPWALGARRVVDAPPIAVDDVLAAIAEMRTRASELVVAAWGVAGRDVPAATIADLRGVDVERGLARLRGLNAPDPAIAERIVGLIEGIGRVLEARGLLPAAEMVWQLASGELDAAALGTPPVIHAGPDRWEPFLAEAAFALGGKLEGTPVAEGLGAGRLHVVSALRKIGRPAPRAVVAAPAPLPQLAPLLWHCAAFITPRGSVGAHLFEVARSLGVPAVIGVVPDDLGPPGSLVAVDGSAGTVASLGRALDGRVRASA